MSLFDRDKIRDVISPITTAFSGFLEDDADKYVEDVGESDFLRRVEVDKKRRAMPCFFNDGLSQDEFEALARKTAKRIKRIKRITVNGAVVHCTVASQTGYSEWSFDVDFNNWGHITGSAKIWYDNADSNIPDHYANMMDDAIYKHFKEKGKRPKNFRYIVNENCDLEGPKGLEFHKKTSLFNKLFVKEKTITSKYDSNELIGEHLYPVISCLKKNGFANVKAIPIKDIDETSNKYMYEVSQIVIDGSSFFEKGEQFLDSVDVFIGYHLKKEIQIPSSAIFFRKKHYLEVGRELQSLGFINIYNHPINDLIVGRIVKDGAVESIAINDLSDFRKNNVFYFDDKVIIKYHTFKSRR